MLGTGLMAISMLMFLIIITKDIIYIEGLHAAVKLLCVCGSCPGGCVMFPPKYIKPLALLSSFWAYQIPIFSVYLRLEERGG